MHKFCLTIEKRGGVEQFLPQRVLLGVVANFRCTQRTFVQTDKLHLALEEWIFCVIAFAHKITGAQGGDGQRQLLAGFDAAIDIEGGHAILLDGGNEIEPFIRRQNIGCL